MKRLQLTGVHRGLRRVRTKLLNGTIKSEHSNAPKRLKMTAVRSEDASCGTACCIGGWLTMELGMRKSTGLWIFTSLDPTGRMLNLFFNFGEVTRTPKGAAGAITRYLETNQKVWR